jgi:hypothetical protein
MGLSAHPADRWYTNDLRQKERQRPNNAAAKTRTAASYPVQFTGRLHRASGMKPLG